MVLLSRPGGTVELRVNGVFVMDTAHTDTERDLALVGLDLCSHPDRVLVGGLGLGFTARACLEDPRVARLTVVEIEQPVVDWVVEGRVPGGPELVADARTEIVVADLADHLRESRTSYDVVLLDIDNGPGYLVHRENERVYEEEFLGTVRSRTAPGGVAVIWSAAEDPALISAMERTFRSAEVVGRSVDLQGRDEQYFLYVGRA